MGLRHINTLGGSDALAGVYFDGWGADLGGAKSSGEGGGDGEKGTWAEGGGGYTVNYPDRGGYTRDCTGRTQLENARRTEQAIRAAYRNLPQDQARKYEEEVRVRREGHFTPRGTDFSEKSGLVALADQYVAGREGDFEHWSILTRFRNALGGKR